MIQYCNKEYFFIKEINTKTSIHTKQLNFDSKYKYKTLFHLKLIKHKI